MSRSLPIDYYPGPVPTELKEIPRYLEQELYRIAESLIAQPVALSVSETGTFTVTTIEIWEQIFVGQTPEWDVPGGNYNVVLGEWTCPTYGLYNVDVQLEVQPFGSGNKVYFAGIRVTEAPVDSAPVQFESTDGGDDSVPLGVTLTGMRPIEQGTVVTVEIAVVHEIFTGLADYSAGWQIMRQSG